MRKPILIVLMLCSLVAFAQQKTIRGVVFDAQFKTPVAFAAVYIENSRFGTIANNLGEFSFTIPDSLTSGNLVISGEGFQMMRLPLQLADAPQLDVFLESSAETNNNGFLKQAVAFVMNDWVPLGNPETNKFDFGRLQTIPTYNPIEGVRLRAGAASNSRLSPHFFVKGYGAYGFRDQKFKYRGEVVYSFNKKVYHDEEFPKNNLRFVHENDIYSPGELHPRANNDLLLVTYRRSKDETTYRNFSELNYEKEYGNGFSHLFWLRRSRLTPQGNLIFNQPIGDVTVNADYLIFSETGVSIRFLGREAYAQQKRKKTLLDYAGPLLILSHSIGLKDFMDGQYSYQRSEFSAQKRFLFKDYGHFDAVGEASKIWGSVPFPLLVYPNQRHRYGIENNAFFLNRSLGFVADEQVTFRTVFIGDKLWLSKINLLNMLSVRELISIRASYGRLSNKNKPQNNDNLFNLLPTMSEYKPGLPYVEGTIGFTHILGLLRIEYVHRFTYRNIPGAMSGAVRIDITI